MIILLSCIGLLACIAVLLPQVRKMIMDLAAQIVHREASTYQSWLRVLLSYAMGGICFILFFDYCTLTDSGRALIRNVKQEIRECLSEIDFRSLLKPALIMFGIYLLGILTIIRANFLYMDDISYSISGYREWYNWSRYVIVFLSYFVQPEISMTDVSPIPQLLAALILSCCSVLLVYILGKGKITIVRLLASIPLGLSPFFLECLSYKYLAPYMALSILVSIIPFLFIACRKAFLFVSVMSLLIMCMTYQAASGIYMMIVVILCFQYWNSKEKTNKEILSFLGTSAIAFCFAMLLFRFFIMKPADYYVSNAMHTISHILPGTLSNIKEYAMNINHDFGIIWKIGIVIVLLFFITKFVYSSVRRKLLSFFISILITVLSFILSFGVYSLLAMPLFAPRALFGFGVFLAILCIYVVSDYKKPAVVAVLALNWCFFIFAFSYGNALADQARYAEFRIGILLHDLSDLYPNAGGGDDLSIQLKNSIDYAPSVKNIAKHNPVIEKLVPKRLAKEFCWDNYYYLEHFNYVGYKNANITANTLNGNLVDYNTLNLPVVLDSYYHTIQSDGEHVLITLKH
ncbi:MAG: glucosyltransferase domain-containing protein [Candidatus Azobacteroides sp.]|nr:glucosyltransferase domain-containing protein [Candidatus Azobacteroides sp.]